MNPSVLRENAREIFLSSLKACSIDHAFSGKLKRIPGATGDLLVIGDKFVELSQIRNIRIIAMGKAASTMLDAFLPYVQDLPKCVLAGILITSQRPGVPTPGFQFFAGGHPTPNQESLDGAKAAISMLRSLRLERSSIQDALCFFLISGGASSMMELPLDLSISLEDTIFFHRDLVHSGASIAEINCVRKHFSSVKGGRLALEAGGIPNYSLLISDVPANLQDALGSGPTLPDSSTVDQCREILLRHDLQDRFPASVRRFFSSKDLQETPKVKQSRSNSLVLLQADDMAAIAKQQAEQMGFYTVVNNVCDDWDYRAAAEYLINCLRELRRTHRRVCLISVGEVTVKLRRAPQEGGSATPAQKVGIGGRNQHFVLYAATLLNALDRTTAIVSGGTDGIDGNSAAAGAVVDEMSVSEDEMRLARAHTALRDYDSGTYLQNLGLSIVTGATGNNLRDLRILMADDPF